MINHLFLRQYERLTLLLHLASTLPVMVCAQSVQKHVGYVPGVEPSTICKWKISQKE